LTKEPLYGNFLGVPEWRLLFIHYICILIFLDIFYLPGAKPARANGGSIGQERISDLRDT
jgi:hypothetical protein